MRIHILSKEALLITHEVSLLHGLVNVNIRDVIGGIMIVMCYIIVVVSVSKWLEGRRLRSISEKII